MGVDVSNWGAEATAPTSSLLLVGADGGVDQRITVSTLLGVGYPSGNKTIVGGATTGTLILNGSDNGAGWINIQSGASNTGNIIIGGGTRNSNMDVRIETDGGAGNLPALEFWGANKWKFYAGGGGAFVLQDQTAVTTALSVDNAAGIRLGVGTAPSFALHVKTAQSSFPWGICKFENTAVNGNAGVYFQNDAQTWVTYCTSSDIYFIRDDTNSKNNVLIYPNSPSQALVINTAATVFNEDGVDQDLRVETTASIRSLFVNGSDGHVSLGGTPSIAGLTIRPSADAGSLPTISGTGGILVAATATSTNVAVCTLLGGTAGSARVNFGDSGNDDQGAVVYDNSTDSMSLQTGAGARLHVNSTGLIVNSSLPGSGHGGDNTISIMNGSAPTSSTTNAALLYALDSVAGQADLYARAENDSIKRLTNTLAVNSSNVGFTAATYSTITGLQFNTLNGFKYRFRAVLAATPNTTGTIQFRIATSGTASAARIQFFQWDITGAAAISSMSTASGLPAAGTATAAGETSVLAIIEGVFVCTGSGLLQAQARNPGATGTSTVLANSYFEIEQVG